MKPSAEQFIEKMGALAEAQGASRISGHIQAMLLLTPGARSLDELAQALQVSKASVSVNARMLAARGLVERTHRRGDRRVFYRMADDLEERMMERALELMRRSRDLFAEALETVAPEHDLVRARLISLRDMHGEIVGRIESNLARLRSAATDQTEFSSERS